MDESKVIDLIHKINELFRKKWFMDSIERYDVQTEEQIVMDLFKEGNCITYANLLYDLFKDNGASIGRSDDHVFIKLNDRYYDAESGYIDNKEQLEKQVLEKGFTSYNLDNEEDKTNFEVYKNKCNTNKYVTEIIEDIKNDLLNVKDEQIRKVA